MLQLCLDRTCHRRHVEGGRALPGVPERWVGYLRSGVRQRTQVLPRLPHEHVYLEYQDLPHVSRSEFVFGGGRS